MCAACICRSCAGRRGRPLRRAACPAAAVRCRGRCAGRSATGRAGSRCAPAAGKCSRNRWSKPILLGVPSVAGPPTPHLPIMAVAYPACCMTEPSVGVPASSGACPSSVESRSIASWFQTSPRHSISSLARICAWPACRPVSRPQRAGEESGAAEYMSVKRTPHSLNASMLGVSIFCCP